VNIINTEGTTVVLLGGLALMLAVGVVVLLLDRRFNPAAPPRDPAATNPWGIGHVDDLMSLADKLTRDDMAAKPRLGELPLQDLDAMMPAPLLGTIPPVRRPSIPSAWRSPGPAAARADKRWRSGDADAAVREIARAFREREERR
jgi:hypothetical protein